MRERPNEAPLPEPLGYFLTWSTYGTWLPGDARGWTAYQHGFQMPRPILELESRARMTEDACRLTAAERLIAERQIAETCGFRGWELFAVNCRSNHIHAVVAAPVSLKQVRSQLKAWCTQALNNYRARQRLNARKNWWAERGSQRIINDEDSLEAAIIYVRNRQDGPRYTSPKR